MQPIKLFIDIILHLDKYLGIIIEKFGISTYLILFLIIFCETGLVLTPFLPGDSLLFVAGAFAASGYFNIFLLFLILFLAAVLGDTLNYWIGNYLGEKFFHNNRLFKKEYLHKTKAFYVKHGGKTIIFARFIPLVRTFAPFVAGISNMNYCRFLAFNVIGGFLWITTFLLGGYFFGRITWVEQNLTLVIFAIIALSFVPPIIEWLRSRLSH